MLSYACVAATFSRVHLCTHCSNPALLQLGEKSPDLLIGLTKVCLRLCRALCLREQPIAQQSSRFSATPYALLCACLCMHACIIMWRL